MLGAGCWVLGAGCWVLGIQKSKKTAIGVLFGIIFAQISLWILAGRILTTTRARLNQTGTGCWLKVWPSTPQVRQRERACAHGFSHLYTRRRVWSGLDPVGPTASAATLRRGVTSGLDLRGQSAPAIEGHGISWGRGGADSNHTGSST